jgi:hypothetical protein
LDPVAESQFAEDATDVGFDGAFGEVELVGDFSVGQVPGDQG